MWKHALPLYKKPYGILYRILYLQKNVLLKLNRYSIAMKQLSDITELFPQTNTWSLKLNLVRKHCTLTMRTSLASTPMSLKKCILRQEDSISLYICNPRELASATMESCCYDAEMDYHYCCPVNESRHMSYKTRVTGSITAAVILFICIILFCILSSRCPLRKVLLNRCSRGAAERMTAAEETPGD